VGSVASRGQGRTQGVCPALQRRIENGKIRCDLTGRVLCGSNGTEETENLLLEDSVKFLIVFGLVFLPLVSSAKCIDEWQQKYNEASKQLKEHKILPSRFEMIKIAYINAKYSCHLIGPDTFCSQIDSTATKARALIKKDYPASSERHDLECRVAKLQYEVRRNCEISRGEDDTDSITAELALILKGCPSL
jgi:hypothetical protein